MSNCIAPYSGICAQACEFEIRDWLDRSIQVPIHLIITPDRGGMIFSEYSGSMVELGKTEFFICKFSRDFFKDYLPYEPFYYPEIRQHLINRISGILFSNEWLKASGVSLGGVIDFTAKAGAKV